MDVYKNCPIFESEKFLLRYTIQEDAEDLLKVYSDAKAVPFFNGDNCHGDNFHYTTLECMQKVIEFWDFSYKEKYFVRWSIIDKSQNSVIGTIELFNRKSEDYFNNCGILRLDLRSDYEKTEGILDILKTIYPSAFKLFDCTKVATKAIPTAIERIDALINCGFAHTKEKLIGHDGQEYGDYYVMASPK